MKHRCTMCGNFAFYGKQRVHIPVYRFPQTRPKPILSMRFCGEVIRDVMSIGNFRLTKQTFKEKYGLVCIFCGYKTVDPVSVKKTKSFYFQKWNEFS